MSALACRRRNRRAKGRLDSLLPRFAPVSFAKTAISSAWPRAMNAIGMPEAGLHSLRHTHASMPIAAGMDILTISRRLGHSSPTITLSVYGHLISGSDDRAAQIMDAAFGSKMVADSAKNS